MRVLLVEAPQSDVQAAWEALTTCHCEVVHAGRLDTALACLDVEPFDVLVSGLHLPDAEGRDVVRLLRGAAPDVALVVLVNGNGDAAVLGDDDGVHGCVPKSELEGPLLERTLRHAVERSRLGTGLAESDARLRLIQEHAPVMICTLTPDGRLTSLNRAFQTMTEHPPAEWVGEPFSRLLHADDRSIAMNLVHRARQGESPPSFDLRMITKSGRHLIGNFTAVPVVHRGDITEIMGIALDVTELRQLEARERELSRTDYLTGLPNRRACEEAVAREVARASRENASVVFALFDIDEFKTVNDTHGHLVGDAVLRAVAGVLKRATRPFDVAGRWAGDELLAVLPGADLQGASLFAERIRAEVEALDGLPCRLTVSAGVAAWTRGQDVAAVLDRADRKLYDAKRAGRNRVC